MIRDRESVCVIDHAEEFLISPQHSSASPTSDPDLLELDYEKSDDIKRSQHSECSSDSQKLHTTIKVLCRIKPRIGGNKPREWIDHTNSIFKTVEREFIELYPPIDKNSIPSFRSSFRSSLPSRPFSMDYVFPESSSQAEIFTRVGLPCLESLFQGINSTIMAYGQTGSGKTHTLLGGMESLNHTSTKGLDPTMDSIPSICGLIPRLIMHCFFKVGELSTNYDFTIKQSVIEIYNEVINDLISGKTNLKTYHSLIERITPTFSSLNNTKAQKAASTDKFQIKDLSEHFVTSPEQSYKLLNQALNNRKIAYTKSNAESSRSHLIVMLEVIQVNKLDGTRKTSVMYIVDLAGSERAENTKTTQNLQEGKMINKSLTCLSKVIQKLSQFSNDKNNVISHIPYRESKLTQILKNSLGGDSKTYFILNCSSEYANYYETLFTLKFGQSAKCVKNVPIVNSEATTITAEAQLKLFHNLFYQTIEWALLMQAYKSGSLDLTTTPLTGMPFPSNSRLNLGKSKQMSMVPSYTPPKIHATSYSYTPQEISNHKQEHQFYEILMGKKQWDIFWHTLPIISNPTLEHISYEIKANLYLSEPDRHTVKVKISVPVYENFKNKMDMIGNDQTEHIAAIPNDIISNLSEDNPDNIYSHFSKEIFKMTNIDPFSKPINNYDNDSQIRSQSFIEASIPRAITKGTFKQDHINEDDEANMNFHLVSNLSPEKSEGHSKVTQLEPVIDPGNVTIHPSLTNSHGSELVASSISEEPSESMSAPLETPIASHDTFQSATTDIDTAGIGPFEPKISNTEYPLEKSNSTFPTISHLSTSSSCPSDKNSTAMSAIKKYISNMENHNMHKISGKYQVSASSSSTNTESNPSEACSYSEDNPYLEEKHIPQSLWSNNLYVPKAVKENHQYNQPSSWSGLLYKCYRGLQSFFYQDSRTQKIKKLPDLDKLRSQNQLLTQYSLSLIHPVSDGSRSSSTPEPLLSEILTSTLTHNSELLDILENFDSPH